ncbi:16587_t:CDS:2, partial [Racocetra persica]
KEIIEKNEKIESLKTSIKELKRNEKENRKLEKQIEDLANQLAEAKRLKEEAKAEKKRVLEQMKAAREALNNLNNELEEQREMMNSQMKQLIVDLNKIQQKYQKILISLGFSEEEIGEDVTGFLTEILGQKITGEATTLKDIREISEVSNLQDLIEKTKQLESEVARLKQIENQQKRKDKTVPLQTLSIEISKGEIKSLQEEAENQEEKLEDLSDEELIERLETKKEEKDLFYLVKKKGQGENIIEEKRSLITDILSLLNSSDDKEFGRAAALVVLAPTTQSIKKLYQFSFQPELVAGIIQNFQQQLAQQANQLSIEKTPVQERFLVEEIKGLRKKLEEKEKDKDNLEKFLQKLAGYLQKDEEDCVEIASEKKDQIEKEA